MLYRPNTIRQQVDDCITHTIEQLRVARAAAAQAAASEDAAAQTVSRNTGPDRIGAAYVADLTGAIALYHTAQVRELEDLLAAAMAIRTAIGRTVD